MFVGVTDWNCNVFDSGGETIILDDVYCWFSTLHVTDQFEKIDANKCYNLLEVLCYFGYNVYDKNLRVGLMGSNVRLF